MTRRNYYAVPLHTWYCEHFSMPDNAAHACMTDDIQLTLDTFAGDGEPLCRRKPELNGFKGLCYYCPRSERQGEELVCTVFGSTIRARDKYSLKGWKDVRKRILARDGQQCVLCGASEALHIHHINLNRTDDHPDNLLTLCEICHARIHVALGREGGRERVEQVLAYIRSGRGSRCQEEEQTRFPQSPGFSRSRNLSGMEAIPALRTVTDRTKQRTGR